MFRIIKDASLQINSLNDKEIVKVAAVVRRLLNWFKQLGDKEYKDQIQKLRDESVSVNIFLTDLSKHLNRLQAAIKDADVQEYEIELDQVKFLSSQLIKELESLQTTTSNVEIKSEPKEQVIQPENVNKVNIPEDIKINRSGYDVPIGNVNKLYKSFEHFNQISGDDIIINNAAKDRIKINITAAFTKNNIDKELLEKTINSENFYILLREAITNGTILENKPVIDPKKQRPDGQMYVTVRTAPFSIPTIPLKLQATVLLTDLFAQKTPKLKLSLMRLTNIDVQNIKISQIIRKKLLKKIAKELPRTYTQISPVRFAEIMAEAYKRVYGQSPTVQMLGMIWAQSAMESGSDKGFSLMNNNVGNISVGLNSEWVKSGQPYVHFNTTEFSSAGKGKNTDMYFKAFPTPLDGAIYYLNFVKKNYPGSIAAPGEPSWKGSGMAFDDAIYLASKTYYTANIPGYAKGMDRYFANFIKNIYPKLNMNLINQPTPPPGPIQQYRKYRKEVASDNPALERPESKSAIYGWQGSTKDIKQEEQYYNTNQNQEYAKNDTTDMNSEFGDLMNYLYRAAGPLDNLVKKSLENKLIQNTQVLIKINSYEPLHNKIDYALVLSDILKEHIEADSTIYSDDKNVELNCIVLGNSKNVINAITSICSSVSDIFNVKRSKFISSVVSLNNISKLAELNINKLDKNYRKIYLENV